MFIMVNNAFAELKIAVILQQGLYYQYLPGWIMNYFREFDRYAFYVFDLCPFHSNATFLG